MRKTLGLVLAFAATSVFAQSLSEKIEVSLVNVDVTVTSHGAPARGLTRDDFEVLEDGAVRPITNFYAVEPATPALATGQAPTANPGVTVADPTDERFRRKVLVIIDNRHVSMFNRDRALAALERFVDDRFSGGVPYRVVVAVHDQVTDAIGISSKTVRFDQTDSIGMATQVVRF